MRKIAVTFINFWLVSLLFLGLTSLAFSAECVEKSPTVKSGKDPYGPITIRELTEKENAEIKTLLQSLDGQWEGGAREVSCNLSDPDEKIVEQYSIKAKAKTDYYGNFFMKMEFYSAKERTTHQKTLRFYLQDSLLRINHDNGSGDVEITALAGNRIELLYRVLVRNKYNSGGIHKEFFFQLEAGSGSLSIDRKVYTQGRLSRQYQWMFHRR